MFRMYLCNWSTAGLSLMILVSALIPDLMMQVTCIREHAWERGSDGSFLVSGSIIRTPYV